MQKVLRKRLLRDLRTNFRRYLALTFLIVLCMYIIISMIAAAETVLTGTERKKALNMVQDGSFSVFLPLTDSEIAELEEDGNTIEPEFSTDIPMNDGSTLRMMKNRQKIDIIQLEDGRQAENFGELVIERRYSEEHDLHVNDVISIAGMNFTICGIGTVPDYDFCVAKASDTSAEGFNFGLMFVTPEQYEKIRSDTVQKAEDYTYAYRLGDCTHEELKSIIKDFDFDYTEVNDKYFRETIDEVLQDKEDFQDGIQELYDGTKELSDGMKELDDNSDTLNFVADKLMKVYLDEAHTELLHQGINETVTEENYTQLLENAGLSEMRETLDTIKEFKDGIHDYTDGVNSAYIGSDELHDGVRELKNETDKRLDDLFTFDLDNLTAFTKASDNPRIGAAAGDVVMNKDVGMLAGVIILVLFTYVISVFVIHQIEQEASVIGALYALGVKKNQLLAHYLTLPTIITFVGGVLGAIAGFSKWGIDFQVRDTYLYYSTPIFEPVYPMYLIVYSVIMPVVVCVIVNWIVINKKLSQTALSLIKNEQKSSNYRQFQLHTKKFTRLFQIRQMIRESRSALTITFGMFICLLILVLGLDCYVLCDNLIKDTQRDMKFSYVYLLKYPEKQVPKDGEAVYMESLQKSEYGYTLDISVVGIDSNNPYFEAVPPKSKSHIIIGDAVAQKYRLSVGDTFTLRDETNETDYSFTVDGIANYSISLSIFMDIDSMRELFGEDEDYYNVIYSDKALDIDEGRLYSVTTREDIEKGSKVFIDLMKPMFSILISVSALILCVVMYLMMGVMIDRSMFGISLMKIFGYRSNEIRQLYLNGNLIVVMVSALICIPSSKWMMDAVYPTFIANVGCGMNIAFPFWMYATLFVSIVAIYLLVNQMLIGKIKKITPAEVLKNRE